MGKRPPKDKAKQANRNNLYKTAIGLLLALAVMVALVSLGSYVSEHWLGYDDRMEPFADAPAKVRQDLLYLSYIDSLARDGRVLPGETPADSVNLPSHLARLAGIGVDTRRQWGLEPEGPGQPLDALMRQMHERSRLVLPEENASLYSHMRDGKVNPGNVVFGRLDSSAAKGVSFVAVLTHINWFNPTHSTLLYQRADGGLVHGTLEEAPKFSYWGAGVPGDDLAQVYLKYFRRNVDRRKKPLY